MSSRPATRSGSPATCCDLPDRLLRAAEAAMRPAYSPYSGFKVGAALRATGGGIHAGANVEDAAYPHGQCAEGSALAALVAAGEREVAAAAIVAEQSELCPPCEGCRQRLVHETIAARQCGLRVAAVSAITNLAEGMSERPLSHEQTLRDAARAATDLAPLLVRLVQRVGA